MSNACVEKDAKDKKAFQADMSGAQSLTEEPPKTDELGSSGQSDQDWTHLDIPKKEVPDPDRKDSSDEDEALAGNIAKRATAKTEGGTSVEEGERLAMGEGMDVDQDGAKSSDATMAEAVPGHAPGTVIAESHITS